MNEDIRAKDDQYYQNERPEVVVAVSKQAKRVLDVGCGQGNFGRTIKIRNEAEVWGIEFNPHFAALAAKELDRVLVGDVSLLVDQLPDGYFDAIVCNDVLEHLIDPYSLLEKFRLKLSPDGVVISSIPNIRYFRTLFALVFMKNWDYASQGILDFTHYRFFTTKSIRKMYDQAGYRVIQHVGIHATKSLKVWPIILLTLGYFNDTRYLQFLTVAKPQK